MLPDSNAPQNDEQQIFSKNARPWPENKKTKQNKQKKHFEDDTQSFINIQSNIVNNSFRTSHEQSDVRTAYHQWTLDLQQ